MESCCDKKKLIGVTKYFDEKMSYFKRKILESNPRPSIDASCIYFPLSQ